MRSVVRCSLIAVLAACGDPAEPPVALGELRSAIIAGREQTVAAGAAALPNAVINQVVRVSSGALMLRATMDGAVVNGSPVAGAVVCVYEQDKDLIPFSRCTNTDTAGKATFFFTPPTKSGAYTARINGSVTTNGVVQATTFDTVRAIVQPGPAVTPAAVGGVDRSIFVGAALALTTLAPITDAKDAFGNSIPTPAAEYSTSLGLSIADGQVSATAVGTQMVRIVAGTLDATRTLYAFDDVRKGVEISSKCLDASADSVVYRLAGTPATANGTAQLTSTATYRLLRAEYQPGGKSEQSSDAGSWTLVQRADSAFVSSGATTYTLKRTGTRAYTAEAGTLCPASFATRGIVRLTTNP